MSSPRSLEDLLSDFNKLKIADVDAAIESNPWAKRFRQHLAKRDLEDEINAFRFLVLTQSFCLKSSELMSVNNNERRKKGKDAKTREEMRETFLRAGQIFFSEESEDQLVLSNERLFDALVAATKEVAKSGQLKDQEVTHMLNARKDPDVWQNGIEPKFMKFLSMQNPSAMACLLSIL